jgi:hypothetical protein
MRCLRNLSIIAGCVLAAMVQGVAHAEPDNTIPQKASDKIVADLAQTDLDALSVDAGKYMGPTSDNSLKNNFTAIKNLGKSQYTDLIYSRDYGQTEKDIIYKIDFEKAFVYVRLLWQVDNGGWLLLDLRYKAEGDLPFPAGWEHIYPK